MSEWVPCQCGGRIELHELANGSAGAALTQCSRCLRVYHARLFGSDMPAGDPVESVPCGKCAGEIRLTTLGGLYGYASVLQCDSCLWVYATRFGEITLDAA